MGRRLRCNFGECGWEPDDQEAVGLVALESHRKEKHAGFRTLRAYEAARLRRGFVSQERRRAWGDAVTALSALLPNRSPYAQEAIEKVQKTIKRWIEMLPPP